MITTVYLNFFHHLPPHSPYKEFLWKLPKKTKYKNDKNEIGITKRIYIKLFHVTWLILRRFSHIFNINASIIEIPDMVFLRLLVILPEIKSCITLELKLWNCCYIWLLAQIFEITGWPNPARPHFWKVFVLQLNCLKI